MNLFLPTQLSLKNEWVGIGVNIDACHLPPNAVVTLQVWVGIGGGAYVSDLQSLTRATRRATIKHIYTDIYVLSIGTYDIYVYMVVCQKKIDKK